MSTSIGSPKANAFALGMKLFTNGTDVKNVAKAAIVEEHTPRNVRLLLSIFKPRLSGTHHSANLPLIVLTIEDSIRLPTDDCLGPESSQHSRPKTFHGRA
jgi:hypothetical protein